jgi:hypothetical protein
MLCLFRWLAILARSSAVAAELLVLRHIAGSEGVLLPTTDQKVFVVLPVREAGIASLGSGRKFRLVERRFPLARCRTGV